MNYLRVSIFSILFLWGFILLFGMIVQVTDGGLNVGGSTFQAEVSPGTTVTHVMTVSVTNVKETTDVKLDVIGFGNNIDGDTIAVSPIDDTSPFSARPFITLDKTLLHLEPNKPEQVTATIRIPSNVGDGGRYAIISLRSIPKQANETVIVAVGVNVPIALTIKNSKINRSISIVDVQYIGPPSPGEIAVAQTTVKNSGNFFIRVVTAIKILDANGNEVFSGLARPSPSETIFPAYSVQLLARIEKELPPGRYTLISNVTIENTTLFDRMTTTFEVKKGYTPPFNEVNITVSPQSAVVLSTSDGMISISFPAGAVLETVKIILRPVLLKSVPVAPLGATLTTTIFSAEGLSGLLSKDATITVKYSSDILNASGGDASKLYLAMWDKADNKWTIVPTTVDKTAGTLSVTTNRLGIWAVMVSEGAVPVTKVDGFTVSIACGALAVLLIMNRLQRR